MPITLFQPIVFGDTSGDLAVHVHAAGQSISIHLPGLADTQTLVGDSAALLDRAAGGADDLTSFAYSGSMVMGDAIAITGHARGGNDAVLSTSNISAMAFGDAETLSGHAEGGNDTVDARGNLAVAYGDALEMADHAKGGDDFVTGAGFPLTVTRLYGDAQTLSGCAIGGDDTITAIVVGTSAVTTAMYGDGNELLDRSRGGDDTLISATNGNDQMWGDAAVVAQTAKTGADKFVFSPSNGNDLIMDFESGRDHIALNGFDFTGFNDVANDIQYTPDGALITFDHDNSILVVGINHLSAGDFILS